MTPGSTMVEAMEQAWQAWVELVQTWLSIHSSVVINGWSGASYATPVGGVNQATVMISATTAGTALRPGPLERGTNVIAPSALGVKPAVVDPGPSVAVTVSVTPPATAETGFYTGSLIDQTGAAIGPKFDIYVVQGG